MRISRRSRRGSRRSAQPIRPSSTPRSRACLVSTADEYSVDLTLLGRDFRVTSSVRRVAELVELLWEPFLRRGPAHRAWRVRIEWTGEMWRFETPEGRPAFAVDPWVLMVVLRNLMAGHAIRSRPDVIPLHASVVERDGFYVALSGPSKAGKTTLVMELLLRGWRLVSDDLAPIAASDGTALPFPKPLQVRDPGRWRRFTAAWEVPEWLPEPEVAALVPAGALAVAPPTAYRPDVLLFSRWDPDADAVLEKLTTAEATALCAQNLQDEREGPAILGPLARVCAAASAARVVYPSTEAAFELVRPLLQD